MSSFQITEKRKIASFLESNGGTCFVQHSDHSDEVWWIDPNQSCVDRFISLVKAVSPPQIQSNSSNLIFTYGVKLVNDLNIVDVELTIRTQRGE